MIRLTLRAHSESEIHLFNKSVILIGNDSAQADLLLPETHLHPIHLKIIEKEGCATLFNLTNDPFVSVNGYSFGKKILNSGDVILIHEGSQIIFESLLERNESAVHDSLENILDKRIKQQENASQSVEQDLSTQLSLDLPFEKEAEIIKEGEVPSPQGDKYLQDETSDLQKIIESLPAKPPTSDHKTIGSLKDDYLRHLEDDNQIRMQPDEPSHLYQAWKWILLFIFSILAIGAMLGTIIYFSLSDKTEVQETKAAQAVADVAMALTHAQLNQLKPHNQNWSDVDFLKNNLQTLLGDTSSQALEIDSHGQFNRFPYSLRVYTSANLSHFLLIAQPAPSLLQWLIPKSVILVDSYNMELRTIKDVRSLNRLLASPDPLEGINGKEITALVKQGRLIRLAALAQEAKQKNFIPPPGQASLSDNFIYNAPRYFRLGQGVIKKAIALSTTKATSQEVAEFKQEIDAFARLPHLILYTEGDREMALKAKQGVMTFAPSDKLQFGYLTWDGAGNTQHLAVLKEDDVPLIDQNNDNSLIAIQTSPISKEEIPNQSDEPADFDVNHPIYVQLQTLAKARENDLQPLAMHLKNLMDNEIACPDLNFDSIFQEASQQFLTVDDKHKKIIQEALHTLYQQYEEIPVEQFLTFISKAGCEHLIREQEALCLDDVNCSQNMETLITQIDNAKSIQELDNLVNIACSWLTLDYVSDPQQLIRHQNQLRNVVLQQVEKIVLAEKKDSLFKGLNAEDRELLQRILSYEKIIKPEEREFFLEEFDHLRTSS